MGGGRQQVELASSSPSCAAPARTAPLISRWHPLQLLGKSVWSCVFLSQTCSVQSQRHARSKNACKIYSRLRHRRPNLWGCPFQVVLRSRSAIKSLAVVHHVAPRRWKDERSKVTSTILRCESCSAQTDWVWSRAARPQRHCGGQIIRNRSQSRPWSLHYFAKNHWLPVTQKGKHEHLLTNCSFTSATN